MQPGLCRPVASPDKYIAALKPTGKRKEEQKMKTGKLSIERRRTFTLEATDIYSEMVCETENKTYTYSEHAACKVLLENQFFKWDCAAFGFPNEMNVLESDSPDTFDIEIIWRN